LNDGRVRWPLHGGRSSGLPSEKIGQRDAPQRQRSDSQNAAPADSIAIPKRMAPQFEHEGIFRFE
jgi:hypothetical protein